MATRVARRRFGTTSVHLAKPKKGGRIVMPKLGIREGMVHNVVKHGLKSWNQRGGGVGASYKD